MSNILKTGFILSPKSTGNYSHYSEAELFFNYGYFNLNDNYRLTPQIIHKNLFVEEDESKEEVIEKDFFKYFYSSFFTQVSNENEQRSKSRLESIFNKDFQFFIKVNPEDSTHATFLTDIKTSSRRYYRWQSNYQVNGEEGIDIENIYMNLPIKHAWLNDKGQKCFSLFPEEVINFFRKVYTIDNERDSRQKFITTKRPENYAFRKSRGRGNRLNPDISTVWMSSNCYADFNFIKKPSPDIIGEQRISVMEFKNCSKGTTPVSYKLKTIPISLVNEKQTLFITKKKFQVYTWNDDYSKVEESEAIYYSFGTFASLTYLSKYKKFRTYIIDFLDKVQNHQGTYLRDMDKYNEMIKEQHKHYVKYWKNLPSLFSSFKDSDYGTISKNNHYMAHELELKEESIASLGTIGSLSHIEEYTQYRDISKAISNMKIKLSSNDSNIQRSDREVRRQEENIKVYQTRLAEAENLIKTAKKKLKDYTVVKDIYPKQIENLENQSIELKEKYLIALSDKINNDPLSKIGFNFISTLKEQGVVVDSIVYWCKEKQANIRLCEDPTIALKAKQSSLENPSNWNTEGNDYLYEIKFRILQPIIIRVDPAEKGDLCKKIIGGPYCVTIYNSALSIGLLTTNSIFGHDESTNNFWVHPHTPSSNYNKANVNSLKSNLMSVKNACLGEASSALYKAFENADPRQAIYAAMAWITSANSTDAWGKNWKFFPTINDINLDSESADILIKQSEKEQINKNLQSSEEIIDNFFPMDTENNIVTPPEDDEVLQLIANETNPAPVSPPPERTTNHNGYVSLAEIRNQTTNQ